ncbi:MAG: hypothetical protein E7E62_08715 [Weissella confusa]|nr:hypothetical protein [Weissella confusa]
MITRNNPQIMREWTANEIETNEYTSEDVYYFLVDIARIAPDEMEARKILILAIRAAKNEGGYSSAYVKKRLSFGYPMDLQQPNRLENLRNKEACVVKREDLVNR